MLLFIIVYAIGVIISIAILTSFDPYGEGNFSVPFIWPIVLPVFVVAGIFEIIKIIIGSVKEIKEEYTQHLKDVKDKPCLTFEQFMIFNRASPKRFILYDDRVKVEFPAEFDEGESWEIDSAEVYYFKTRRDLKRYKKWRSEEKNKREEYEVQKAISISLSKLGRLMQYDIEERLKENEKQLQFLAKEQKSILERMKNDKRIGV